MLRPENVKTACLVNNLHDQNKGSDKSRISQRRNEHHFPISPKKIKYLKIK